MPHLAIMNYLSINRTSFATTQFLLSLQLCPQCTVLKPKTFHNILEKSSTYDPTTPPTPYYPKQGNCSEGFYGIP